MMYNYLKIILRNFRNDRLYTVIIILGLSVGLSCCLMIAQYIHFELSFDKDVKDRDQIYYAYMRWESPEGEYDMLCHPAVGPLIKTSVPEVSDFVRMAPGMVVPGANHDELVLTTETGGESAFNERENAMYFADPEVLTIFSIPMRTGDAQSALRDLYSVVITEGLAEKLFPGGKALDKLIKVKFSRTVAEFKITGIAENPKHNSSLRFKALFSMNSLDRWNALENSWTFSAFSTFIKLRPGADPLTVQRKINAAAKEHLTALEKQFSIKESIQLFPFSQFHFYHSFNGWGIATVKFTGDKRLIIFFGILGVLILIVSWANYINLTTARALRRAREVALRKVNGAGRRNIIIQFITEFLFLNITSMFLALTIAQLLFTQFVRVIGSNAQWTFWWDPLFWLIVTVFIIVSTIASGFYPAFIISAYNPAKVLKGNFSKSQSGTTIRNGLVLLQFRRLCFYADEYVCHLPSVNTFAKQGSWNDRRPGFSFANNQT